MGRFLKRRVNTVFLMLGNSCNMNCRYCLQHPLVTRQLAGEINPDIYAFLEECASELPKGQKLHIQFYGGEPLLYFANIREIAKHTKGYAWFSVITNGKAVTDKMVAFFNAYDMPVTISWDGRNVLESRGFDVFAKSADLRARLLKIKRLGLSAVLSSKAYPREILESFQEVSDEYYKVHGYQVSINIDEIFDTGGLPEDLLEVDYIRVEKEMTELAKFYLAKKLSSAKTALGDYTKIAYIDRLFGMLKSFYVTGEGKYTRNFCSCGNGYAVLNLDLSGNLYSCHNTSEAIGTIRDDYFSYLNKLLAGDSTLKHKKQCEVCPAVAFCRGGCKLVSDKARKAGYCRLKQAVFLPVVSLLEEYGRQIGGANDG